MADCLRECAEHGEEFGVIVAVQNHGDFISTGPSTSACSSAWHDYAPRWWTRAST